MSSRKSIHPLETCTFLLLLLTFNGFEAAVLPLVLEQFNVNIWAERHRSVDTQYCTASTNLHLSFEGLPLKETLTKEEVWGRKPCPVSIKLHLLKDYKRKRTICFYKEPFDNSVLAQDIKIDVEGLAFSPKKMYRNVNPVGGFIVEEPNSVVQGYLIKKMFYGTIRLYDKFRLYHIVFYIEPLSNVQLYNPHYATVEVPHRPRDNAVLFEYVSHVAGSRWVHCNSDVQESTPEGGNSTLSPTTSQSISTVSTASEVPSDATTIPGAGSATKPTVGGHSTDLNYIPAKNKTVSVPLVPHSTVPGPTILRTIPHSTDPTIFIHTVSPVHSTAPFWRFHSTTLTYPKPLNTTFLYFHSTEAPTLKPETHSTALTRAPTFVTFRSTESQLKGYSHSTDGEWATPPKHSTTIVPQSTLLEANSTRPLHSTIFSNETSTQSTTTLNPMFSTEFMQRLNTTTRVFISSTEYPTPTVYFHSTESTIIEVEVGEPIKVVCKLDQAVFEGRLAFKNNSLIVFEYKEALNASYNETSVTIENVQGRLGKGTIILVEGKQFYIDMVSKLTKYTETPAGHSTQIIYRHSTQVTTPPTTATKLTNATTLPPMNHSTEVVTSPPHSTAITIPMTNGNGTGNSSSSSPTPPHSTAAPLIHSTLQTTTTTPTPIYPKDQPQINESITFLPRCSVSKGVITARNLTHYLITFDTPLTVALLNGTDSLNIEYTRSSKMIMSAKVLNYTNSTILVEPLQTTFKVCGNIALKLKGNDKVSLDGTIFEDDGPHLEIVLDNQRQVIDLKYIGQVWMRKNTEYVLIKVNGPFLDFQLASVYFTTTPVHSTDGMAPAFHSTAITKPAPPPTTTTPNTTTTTKLKDAPRNQNQTVLTGIFHSTDAIGPPFHSTEVPPGPEPGVVVSTRLEISCALVGKGRIISRGQNEITVEGTVRAESIGQAAVVQGPNGIMFKGQITKSENGQITIQGESVIPEPVQPVLPDFAAILLVPSEKLLGQGLILQQTETTIVIQASLESQYMNQKVIVKGPQGTVFSGEIKSVFGDGCTMETVIMGVQLLPPFIPIPIIVVDPNVPPELQQSQGINGTIVYQNETATIINGTFPVGPGETISIIYPNGTISNVTTGNQSEVSLLIDGAIAAGPEDTISGIYPNGTIMNGTTGNESETGDLINGTVPVGPGESIPIYPNGTIANATTGNNSETSDLINGTVPVGPGETIPIISPDGTIWNATTGNKNETSDLINGTVPVGPGESIPIYPNGTIANATAGNNNETNDLIDHIDLTPSCVAPEDEVPIHLVVECENEPAVVICHNASHLYFRMEQPDPSYESWKGQRVTVKFKGDGDAAITVVIKSLGMTQGVALILPEYEPLHEVCTLIEIESPGKEPIFGTVWNNSEPIIVIRSEEPNPPITVGDNVTITNETFTVTGVEGDLISLILQAPPNGSQSEADEACIVPQEQISIKLVVDCEDEPAVVICHNDSHLIFRMENPDPAHEALKGQRIHVKFEKESSVTVIIKSLGITQGIALLLPGYDPAQEECSEIVIEVPGKEPIIATVVNSSEPITIVRTEDPVPPVTVGEIVKITNQTYTVVGIDGDLLSLISLGTPGAPAGEQPTQYHSTDPYETTVTRPFIPHSTDPSPGPRLSPMFYPSTEMVEPYHSTSITMTRSRFSDILSTEFLTGNATRPTSTTTSTSPTKEGNATYPIHTSTEGITRWRLKNATFSTEVTLTELPTTQKPTFAGFNASTEVQMLTTTFKTKMPTTATLLFRGSTEFSGKTSTIKTTQPNYTFLVSTERTIGATPPTARAFSASTEIFPILNDTLPEPDSNITARRRKRDVLFNFNKFFGEDAFQKLEEDDVSQVMSYAGGLSDTGIFDLRNEGPKICELCVWIQPHFAEMFGLGGGILHGMSEVVDIIKFVDWIFRAMDFNGDGLAENIGFKIKQLVLREDVQFGSPGRRKRDARRKRQGLFEDYYENVYNNEINDNDTHYVVPANIHNLENKVKEFSRDPKILAAKQALDLANEQLQNKFTDCCAVIGFIYHDMVPTISASTERGLCSYQNLGLISGYLHQHKLLKFDILRGVLHVLGHLFGAPHDNMNDLYCYDNQIYEFLNPMILHPIAQTNVGARPNSFRFSRCTRDHITMFLSSSASKCLKSESSSSREFCGDGMVGDGEECDCGSPWQCHLSYPCCGEKDALLGCKIVNPEKKNCHRPTVW